MTPELLPHDAASPAPLLEVPESPHETWRNPNSISNNPNNPPNRNYSTLDPLIYDHLDDDERSGGGFNKHGWSKLEWLTVGLVLLATMADYQLTTVYSPILPTPIAQAFYCYTTPCNLLINMIIVAKPSVELVINLFIGRYIDKVGPRKPIMMGLIAMTISLVFFSLALCDFGSGWVQIVLFLIARAIQGGASALSFTGGNTLIVLTFGTDERGAAVAVVNAGNVLGFLGGFLVGGPLYNVAHVLPFLMILLTLFCAFVVLAKVWKYLLYCDRPEMPFRETTSWKILVDPYVSMLLFLAWLFHLMWWLLTTLMPTFLESYFQTSTTQIGYMLSLPEIIYLVMLPAIGYLVDKLGSRKWKLISVSFLIGVPATLIMLFPVLIKVGDKATIHTVLLGLGLFGLARPLIDTTTLPLLADIADSRGYMFGRAFALLGLFWNCANVLGLVMGPILRDALSPSWDDDAHTQGILRILLTFTGLCLCSSGLPYLFRTMTFRTAEEFLKNQETRKADQTVYSTNSYFQTPRSSTKTDKETGGAGGKMSAARGLNEPHLGVLT